MPSMMGRRRPMGMDSTRPSDSGRNTGLSSLAASAGEALMEKSGEEISATMGPTRSTRSPSTMTPR